MTKRFLCGGTAGESPPVRRCGSAASASIRLDSERLNEAKSMNPQSDHQEHADARQDMRHWRRGGERIAPNMLIHEIFEQQAAGTPNAVAVTYESRSLNYLELNLRANQVAHRLMARGVRPGELVGICAERSLEMVIGILAILKSGGAYLPLDPVYPPERLAYILNDAAPKVLLIQERLKDNVAFAEVERVTIENPLREAAIAGGMCNPTATLGRKTNQLAYVIYTSGSTGKPKGVMVEHANVTRLLSATDDLFHFNERDVWTLFHSFAFDFSVWEIWGALLYGGRLVVVPYAVSRSPKDFYRLICAEKVTVLNLTPSAFTRLIEAQDRGTQARHCLRVVVFGGEALPVRAVRPWTARHGLERPILVNMYGITETTVHVTHHVLGEADIKLDEYRGVGVPLRDLRAYVLDECLRPVPQGVTGEIYVGGAGVARGYLNRPGLTAERFLADPFSCAPTSRLYKTGDLGRWRADGGLEYLGRNDRQVKIRGFRVELGEIEAQLRQHPQVQDAVVVISQDEPDNTRLVAYVVCNEESPPDPAGDSADDIQHWEWVERWKEIYQATYAVDITSCDPSFAGWVSSFTGLPIPVVEMREWVAVTVERLREFRPQRILEIGCGVGLLLQHLAPQCEAYVATDISDVAIERLRGWMSGREQFSHVELICCSAMDLESVPERSFDTVVLNSVVQYFPNIDYLVTVIQRAARLLREGGRLFLGDVRHLGLLPLFHGAVQCFKADPAMTVKELRKRVNRAVAQEKELVIDPQFFLALPGRVQAISAAEILLKRGTTRNELTCYRYDVILHRGGWRGETAAQEPLDWNEAVGGLSEFEDCLRERRWCTVCLRAIPNARLSEPAALHALIESSDETCSVGQLRSRLETLQVQGIDPERIADLCQAYGYEIRLQPGSGATFSGSLFRRPKTQSLVRDPPRVNGGVCWNRYANRPCGIKRLHRPALFSQLRDQLEDVLPEYMIPSAWVALEAWPLTPNGKVDLEALPSPLARPEHVGEYLAPSTDLERTLAEIWAELLQVERVGILDSFFALGGHSMTSMDLSVRVAQRLSVEIDPHQILRYPTIRDMAEAIEQMRNEVHPALADDSESDEFML